jgi:hypothetical protein
VGLGRPEPSAPRGLIAAPRQALKANMWGRCTAYFERTLFTEDQICSRTSPALICTCDKKIYGLSRLGAIDRSKGRIAIYEAIAHLNDPHEMSERWACSIIGCDRRMIATHGSVLLDFGLCFGTALSSPYCRARSNLSWV